MVPAMPHPDVTLLAVGLKLFADYGDEIYYCNGVKSFIVGAEETMKYGKNEIGYRFLAEKYNWQDLLRVNNSLLIRNTGV